MDIKPSTGNIDGFWLLWRIGKEYIKWNIVTVVLRKANGYSVVTCRLMKQSIM